jgi:type I restriction enzyme, S subunit
MNAAKLLEHFDRLADTPEAVQRLRRFILDLAVRGKLVEQDAKDEPATELLKLAECEKSRLAKTGTTKPTAHYPVIGPEEQWCTVPAGWVHARLGAITNIVMGTSPPGTTYNRREEGIPLINGPVEFSEGPFGKTVVNQFTTEPKSLCEPGDFLICVRGSTTGRTNVASCRACIGRGVASIQPLFEDRFVRLCICSRRQSIIEMGRGIAFPSISRSQLECLVIPLPPHAEQVRVVAKVDELTGLCDQLEVQLANAQAGRRRLLEALLHQAIGH